MILKETIKQLRNELKKINYQLKTQKAGFSENKVFAQLYLNNIFIYGSGCNVYDSIIFEKNKKAIEIFKKYEV